ncbi:MAG: class I SAM-dependent methyltransferase [Methylocella sp.]
MNTPKPCLIECPVLATEENFDEQQYLHHHPDVAAAVAQGDIKSGRAHFRQHGHGEGRLLRIEYVEYVSEVGLSTPLPSSDLIHLVGGHRDYRAFDVSRRNAIETIIALLGQAGIDYANFRSILDLGCGCGRILAGWEGRLSPETRLFGCDINPMLVEFCREKISHAEVVRNLYYPPLPYGDSQFDFIYAISVYTHLSLPAMLQWTGEILRILRPEGIALITTHGSYYSPSLTQISREGSALLAERGYYVHLFGPASETWEGSNNYAAYVSPDFLRRLFVGFQMIRMFPGVSHGPILDSWDQVNTTLVAYQDIFQKIVTILEPGGPDACAECNRIDAHEQYQSHISNHSHRHQPRSPNACFGANDSRSAHCQRRLTARGHYGI